MAWFLKDFQQSNWLPDISSVGSSDSETDLDQEAGKGEKKRERDWLLNTFIDHESGQSRD